VLITREGSLATSDVLFKLSVLIGVINHLMINLHIDLLSKMG
jgi:hypothetical protein